MYVNKTKAMVALGSIKVKTIIWGIVGGMFLMSFVGSFLPEMKEKYGIGPVTYSALAFVAICGLFIYLNLQKRKKINLAYRLSNVFENDSDATMMTNEIANAVHLSTPALEQNLLWLINNNYNQSRIILTDVNEAATNEFAIITCQACGSKIQVRPGQSAKCPSCGTFIAAS